MRIVPPLVEHKYLFFTLVVLSLVMAMLPIKISPAVFTAYTYCEPGKFGYVLRDSSLLHGKGADISISEVDTGIVHIKSSSSLGFENAKITLQNYVDDAKKWKESLVFDDIRLGISSPVSVSIMEDYPVKLLVYLFCSVVICLAWDDRKRLFYESEVEEV